jgi:hypothetical protein
VKNGWNEVARLGTAEDGYPHVLVDAHGWCLRLGRTRSDEKFYSNLPSLLQGLIEHVIRRHLRDCGTLNSAESMLTEVRVALDQAARFQSTLAAATHQQSTIRLLEPLKDIPPAPNLLLPGEAAWLAQSPYKELHRTAERKVIAHLGSSPDGYPHILNWPPYWIIAHSPEEQTFHVSLQSVFRRLIYLTVNKKLTDAAVISSASGMWAVLEAALSQADRYQRVLVTMAAKDSTLLRQVRPKPRIQGPTPSSPDSISQSA